MKTNANQTRKTVRIAVPLAVLAIASAALAERGSRLNIIVSPNRQTLPDNADDKRQNLAAPKSLKTLAVPEPPNLSDFVKNRSAAIVLGKALFWDQQVGSDGVQACASCHSHAGADNRPKNTVNPGGDGLFAAGNGPNTTRTAADFPLHKLSATDDRLSAVLRDTNDIVGSQGVFDGTFLSVTPGNSKEIGKPITDPVYHVGLVNTRRVTGRQAPSVINAAFNYNNFWDGRANFVFNGVNPFGDADANARVYVNNPGATATAPSSMAAVAVHITNASLASQAVGPPGSDTEMSLARRTFPDIGKKLLTLRPLNGQTVDPTDSVLGSLSRVTTLASRPGLNTTYKELVQAAFQDQYWNSTTQMVSIDTTGAKIVKKTATAPANNYSQMEANFSLFFGLAVQMYESTLISDDSPFDRFQEGDKTAMTISAQQGLNLFMTPADPTFAGGSCFNCHFGPEFTKATVSNVGRVSFLGDLPERIVERMAMGDGGGAFYDSGFYNIGVRPTEEDLGRGGNDPFGYPLSFTKRALMNETTPLPFPNPPLFCGDGQPTPCPMQRVALDGTFKTPTLRNVELTGPYFHNGGQATLMQVLDFYTRGGDFHEHNIATLDSDIQTIDGMTDTGKRQIVDFLLALTDERVRWEKAPFDHPELILPNGSPGTGSLVNCLPSTPCDETIRLPPVGAAGRAAQSLPPLGTFLALDPHTR
ncbi:MAG: cytochrome C peroxidase [Deltaproteobacteria bacterium]|nr:MAG: cytochrome C peroxidase [Deltaproteobacteria bacterium]